jgi:hypothetical protein
MILVRGLLVLTALGALSAGITRIIGADVITAMVIGFAIGVFGGMLTESWVFGDD